MSVSEADIEKALKAECKALGIWLIKLGAFNQVGIPDRLLLAKPGRAMFLELKRPSGVTARRQYYWQRKLRKFGFICEHTHTKEDAIEAARWHARVPK